MHVSEREFAEKMNNDLYFGMTCPDFKLESTKPLIEELKKINKNDPGFLYTCAQSQSGRTTIWHFSYTKYSVYAEAKALVIADAEKDAEEAGLPKENAAGSMPLFTSECACPFLG